MCCLAVISAIIANCAFFRLVKQLALEADGVVVWFFLWYCSVVSGPLPICLSSGSVCLFSDRRCYSSTSNPSADGKLGITTGTKRPFTFFVIPRTYV